MSANDRHEGGDETEDDISETPVAFVEPYEVEFFLLMEDLHSPHFDVDDIRDEMDTWRASEELKEKVVEFYQHPSAALEVALKQVSTVEEFIALDPEVVA